MTFGAPPIRRSRPRYGVFVLCIHMYWKRFTFAGVGVWGSDGRPQQIPGSWTWQCKNDVLAVHTLLNRQVFPRYLANYLSINTSSPLYAALVLSIAHTTTSGPISPKTTSL